MCQRGLPKTFSRVGQAILDGPEGGWWCNYIKAIHFYRKSQKLTIFPSPPHKLRTAKVSNWTSTRVSSIVACESACAIALTCTAPLYRSVLKCTAGIHASSSISPSCFLMFVLYFFLNFNMRRINFTNEPFQKIIVSAFFTTKATILDTKSSILLQFVADIIICNPIKRWAL